MNPMKHGYGMPTVKAYYNGEEIPGQIENFKYTYSEEEPDDCNFDVKGLTINDPDKPVFQERAKWVISWGYIGHTLTTRIIYLNDLDWSYDDEIVTASIQGSDKAITFKQASSNKIHKKSNLVDLVHNIAEKHGVEGYIAMEVSAANDPDAGKLTEEEKAGKNFIELIAASEHKRKAATKTIMVKSLDAKFFSDSFKKQAEIRENIRKGIPGGGLLPDDSTLSAQANTPQLDQQKEMVKRFLKGLKAPKDIPQGNKSDMQLLKEEGMKEDGQYLIDTRDNKVTLRKRNFNQAPYQSYYYRKEPGYLLSFHPLTSNKSRKGSSINQNFTGWDKQNKRFFSGDANTVNDKTRETLNKYQEELKSLKDIPDNALINTTGGIKVFATVTGNVATGGTDNTRTQMNIRVPVKAMDRKNALQAVLDQFNQEGHNSTFHDPTAKTPEDAFNHASNNRNNSGLKKNHGTFKLVGDPNIESGKVITILNVSKKHSGNYYITKCTHEIDQDYTVTGEIIRHGHNVKSAAHYVSAKESNKAINNDIGPDLSAPKSNQLPILSNEVRIASGLGNQLNNEAFRALP